MNKDKQIKSTDWLTKGYTKEELATMKAEAIKEAEIEEMAKDFCAVSIPCEECHLYKNRCHAKKYATRAYNAGYRKASDVAAEIFAEIEEARERWESVYSPDYFGYGGSAWGYLETDVDHTIYELKKKYTEDEG